MLKNPINTSQSFSTDINFLLKPSLVCGITGQIQIISQYPFISALTVTCKMQCHNPVVTLGCKVSLQLNLMKRSGFQPTFQ